MDYMQMVEKLREYANVTYEEAKAALDEANGDLLEAVILLERQGKTKQPEQSTYTTKAEEQPQYLDVRERIEQQEKKASDCFGKKAGRAMKKMVNILKRNFFRVTRNEELFFQMPAWVFALILLFFWETVIPVMLIALFFGIRYSFTGEDDLASANDFMEKAGDMADEVKSEFVG